MKTNRTAEFFGRPHPINGHSARTIVMLALLALACGDALAQEPTTQQQRDDGPPPMRYLPEDVRRRLDGEHDPKARTRLSLEIAEERLTLAAQQADADHFEAATGEVGVYEAVVEDAVRFLHTSGRVNNKMRDIFKHFEIALRSHVTRLETIRRELPAQHAVYLKDAIEFVRDNRDQALGAFYDDTVMPEPHHPAGGGVPNGERAKANALAAPEVDKKPDQHR
ncbi:MAG: hypothetical protein QOJ76_1745 [Acidobacteriota bacterium]|jgi:hypothetical protein|nr:hypothetical protein [Acidobacteriota bacterium]